MHSFSSSLVLKIREKRQSGLSYKSIARNLAVSPTSALKYSRDIRLSTSQSEALAESESENRKTFTGKFSCSKKISYPCFSEEFANVLGHLFFDGSVIPNPSRYVISYTNASLSLVKSFSLSVSSLFGLPLGKISSFQGVNFPWYTCYCYSKEACEFLLRLSPSYSTSSNARVPAELFALPDSVKSSFLRAFWDDEGSISDSGKLQGSLVSKAMIFSISQLHSDLGIDNAVFLNKNNRVFTVYINRNKENFDRFQKFIGFTDSMVVHGKNSGRLKRDVLQRKMPSYRKHLKHS